MRPRRGPDEGRRRLAIDGQRWCAGFVAALIVLAQTGGCAPPRAGVSAVSVRHRAPAVPKTPEQPSAGLSLCAAAVAARVDLFPIENAALVSLEPDWFSDEAFDEFCPSRLFEVRDEGVVPSPFMKGLPCHDRHNLLAAMGGRLPERACATYELSRDEITLVRERGAWVDDPQLDGGCELLSSWVQDRQITVVGSADVEDEDVGKFAYHLAVRPGAERGFPPLPLGRVVAEKGYVRPRAEPFAMGAAADGTVAIAWEEASTSDVLVERWSIGERKTVIEHVDVAGSDPYHARMRVRSRDDITLVVSAIGLTGPGQVTLLQFDGAHWNRIASRPAAASTLTQEGDAVLAGDAGFSVLRADGSVNEEPMQRALVDGVPVKLILHRVAPMVDSPAVWAQAAGDPWLAAGFVQESQDVPDESSEEWRTIHVDWGLFRVCPAGRPARSAVRLVEPHPREDGM